MESTREDGWSRVSRVDVVVSALQRVSHGIRMHGERSIFGGDKMSTVRTLQNRNTGSTFGDWHRVSIPSNRTLTDIDAIEGTTIVEVRSMNYVAPKPDRAMSALESFAVSIGWDFHVRTKFGYAAHTLDCIYVIEKAGRHAVFAVRGNRSRVRPDGDWPLLAWRRLLNSAEERGIPTAEIVVDASSGRPVRSEYIDWITHGGYSK